MSKSKTRSQKEETIKKFIKLTWEIVRRNPEYQEEYKRYLQDCKNSFSPLPLPPQGRTYAFNSEKSRYVSKDNEDPDPERCNRSYMVQKWGFFSDPANSYPLGASWQLSFSNDWKKIRKGSEPLIQPLLFAEELQNLPGVLRVARWPELRATDESLEKYQDAGQEFLESLKSGRSWDKPFPPLQWEIKDSQLNITINLKAPHQFIMHALKFLTEVCKADLKFKDKDVEWDMIPTYLKAWDLRKQNLSDEEIAREIPLKQTRPRLEKSRPENEAQREADQEINGEEHYNIARIKDYIEKAQTMINNGSII